MEKPHEIDIQKNFQRTRILKL